MSQSKEDMNSSAISHRDKMHYECELRIFLGGTLDHTTKKAHAVLLFLAVVNIITFPITSAFNTLVIIAVKTRPQLRTMSNVGLACLATTDAIMGVVGQPLFIVFLMANIQGDFSITFCSVEGLLLNVVRVLGVSSTFHLVLLNVERFIAIKRSLDHSTMVTEARMLGSSAVAWIVSLLLTVPLAIIDNNVYLIVTNISGIFGIAVVMLCQVVLYRETRRHQREIASQQVSVEARKKFLKDQKALKLTTTVLSFLILTYSPFFVVRILIAKSVINSLSGTYIAFFTSTNLIPMNSLFNPIIYGIRLRQFRVAFIEIVFRKSNTQAENIDIRISGTVNVLAPNVEGQELEENANNEQENSPNRGNIDENFCNNTNDDNNNMDNDCNDNIRRRSNNNKNSIKNNNNDNSDNNVVNHVNNGDNTNDSSSYNENNDSNIVVDFNNSRDSNNNGINDNNIVDDDNNRRNSTNNNNSIENNDNSNNNIVDDDDNNGDKSNDNSIDSCNNNYIADNINNGCDINRRNSTNNNHSIENNNGNRDNNTVDGDNNSIENGNDNSNNALSLETTTGATAPTTALKMATTIESLSTRL